MARKSSASRTSGKLTPAESRELIRIEDALGEEFESLAEARKALKQESLPRKSTYTIKELSSRRHKTVRTFVTDLERHTKEIDQLKDNDDYWAAEIYGYKTYSVYGSIEGLARRLGSYRGLQEEHPKAALKNIKIVRIHGKSALEGWIRARRKQTQDSWKRTLAAKAGRKRKARKFKKLHKAFSTLQQEHKAALKKIKALEKKLKKKS